MTKPKPRSYYVPDKTPFRSAAVRCGVRAAVVLLLTFALSVPAALYRRAEKQNVAEPLCTVTQPCDIVVDIKFDRKPVDIVVTAPDGLRSALNTVWTVDAADSNHVTAIIPTDVKGDWTVEYQPMMNRNIEIKILQKAPSRMYVDNLVFKNENGSVMVSFTPVLDSEDPFKCLIQIWENSKSNYVLYNGSIDVNKAMDIRCDTSRIPDIANGTVSVHIYPDRDHAVTFKDGGLRFAYAGDDSFEYIETGVSFSKTNGLIKQQE